MRCFRVYDFLPVIQQEYFKVKSPKIIIINKKLAWYPIYGRG